MPRLLSKLVSRAAVGRTLEFQESPMFAGASLGSLFDSLSAVTSTVSSSHSSACTCSTCIKNVHGSRCTCSSCLKGSQHQLGCACFKCVPAHGVSCKCNSCRTLQTASNTSSNMVVSHAAGCRCASCNGLHGRGCVCARCSVGLHQNKHSSACACPTCMPQFSYQQFRGMACSAGLGRAPPQKVMIEYDPEDVDAYIEIADAIEAAFPNVVVEGNESKDGRKFSFEVSTSDGFQVYSKLHEKRYPSPDDLIARISNRVSDAAIPAAEGRFCQ